MVRVGNVGDSLSVHWASWGDPRLAELEAGGRLAVRGPTREDEGGELRLPEAAVESHPFRLEQAGVDTLPQRPEVGEVTQTPFESRHVGVQVEPVHAIDCQGHVLRDKLGNVGYGLLLGVATRNEYHPTGVRGKGKLSPTDVAFTGRFEAKLR